MLNAFTITMYYTNNVGIAATAAGTVMLLAKFADGISDLFFAWVMERVHFKMGKARPWLLISGPLLGVAVILCFNIPAGLSDGGKVVYALLTYTFMQAVSVTVFWLAYQTLFPLISHDPQDRNVIQSISNLLANAAGMVITLAMPFAFMVWGGVSENGAWSNVSICIAIISTVLVIISALVCKEKDTSDLDYEIETVSSEKELTTMQLVNMVFSQKRKQEIIRIYESSIFFDTIAPNQGGIAYERNETYKRRFLEEANPGFSKKRIVKKRMVPGKSSPPFDFQLLDQKTDAEAVRIGSRARTSLCQTPF